MARKEINIPDDLDFQVQRLVDDGEFTSYEDAIQSLLSSGLTAHRTSGETSENDEFSDFEDDFGNQEPPGHDDEYAF